MSFKISLPNAPPLPNAPHLPNLPQPALPGPIVPPPLKPVAVAVAKAVGDTVKATEVAGKDTINTVAKAADDTAKVISTIKVEDGSGPSLQAGGKGFAANDDGTGIDDGQCNNDGTDPSNPDTLSNPDDPNDLGKPDISPLLQKGDPVTIDPTAGQPSMTQGFGAQPHTGDFCTTLSTNPACDPTTNPADDLPEEKDLPTTPQVVD
jgi:hypothetical protein